MKSMIHSVDSSSVWYNGSWESEKNFSFLFFSVNMDGEFKEQKDEQVKEDEEGSSDAAAAAVEASSSGEMVVLSGGGWYKRFSKWSNKRTN